MKLREICGDIKHREIILYGETEDIREFLSKYQKKLYIKFVMTEHKKEVKIQAYKEYGVQTKLVDDVIFGDELIIICDKRKFGVWYRRLKYLGRIEYKDFISKELVDALYRQKELMVCMGTHMLFQVFLLLNHEQNVLDKFSIVYFAESEICEAHFNRYPEYEHVCKFADVYTYSSCEKERSYLKILDKKKMSTKCKRISISDYGFCGFYPQIVNDRNAFSALFLRERERYDFSYETLFFSRADKEIEKMCRQGLNSKEIKNNILSEKYYSPSEVKRFFKQEVKRVCDAERFDDIKMGKFIEEHSKEFLCINLNEWKEPMISYIANELLKIIGLKELCTEINDRQEIISSNSGSEILLYPSVQKALELDENLEEKKYKVTTFFRTRHMFADEYLEFMIKYIYEAKALLDFMGTDEELYNELVN